MLDFAKIAYEAFYGDRLPAPWEEVSPEVKALWDRCAQAVLAETLRVTEGEAE